MKNSLYILHSLDTKKKSITIAGEKDKVMDAFHQVQKAIKTAEKENKPVPSLTPDEQHIELPPYWSKVKGQGHKVKDYTVKVDQKTEAAIKDLVTKTWRRDIVGAGNDAKGLSHRDIRVTKVMRVENTDLYYSYAQKRKELIRRG